METTVSKLERQIEERLKGVSEYESININHRLGKLLDSYDIPDVAKVACLTIDTSMRHLDDITYNHLSKHSILIGDLINAHFYTLLAEINDLSFQNEISKAIVEINELKSSLHHQALNDYEISQAIVKIETLFPYITLSHFGINIDESEIYNYLFEDMSDYYPSYFKKYNQSEVKHYLHDIQKSYLKSRGN
ncbi:hypothetical protein [Staphylococcus aureus]|uniref:hypothetical protein n=1 Tax=Staphylococcus aureus TaxID=1280 RepID=UPI0007CA2D39|nr:hypothetical protein [Staphylococcus aureus]SAZ98711.1 heptaprenyl diphosphate synthase (HEPPP synthase) subunit 1 family protein [Staphylococcus aureus]